MTPLPPHFPEQLKELIRTCLGVVAADGSTCGAFERILLDAVTELYEQLASTQRALDVATKGQLCETHGNVVIGIGGCHACAEEAWGWKARAETAERALAAATQELETLKGLVALTLKVDGWDPPDILWLKTPADALRAMTLNMAQSRDELKHHNRTLEANLAALQTKLDVTMEERDAWRQALSREQFKRAVGPHGFD